MKKRSVLFLISVLFSVYASHDCLGISKFLPPRLPFKNVSASDPRGTVSPVFINTMGQRGYHVGMDMLNRGGSAVDAVLAGAITDITRDMGLVISFAGIMEMLYYEASTGLVHSLNAGFKTLWNENDPLTIPTGGYPNSRAVLVPGFMAGVQAAHDRFGELPFETLFEDAIDLAENGFPIGHRRVEHIKRMWHVLGSTQEGRRIFLKPKYGLFRGYEAGDTFRQPELAATLCQVAARGADYMYSGAW
jgi:gamma-glutamyltranspeptidase/glutathione hydrolase